MKFISMEEYIINLIYIHIFSLTIDVREKTIIYESSVSIRGSVE